MFRLSKPGPYQKTPLFPSRPQVKPKENDDAEEKKEEEDITEDDQKEEEEELKDDNKYIPIIFRSFKQADLYSVPKSFASQILEDKSSSTKPMIAQVYPTINNILSAFKQKWNSQFYGCAENLILNVPSQTEVTPFLCKKEEYGDIYLGTMGVQFAVQFNKLMQNHRYIGHIGDTQPWEDIDISLTNSEGGTLHQNEKIIRVDIPIQYVQFNEYMRYMYIYINGIRKEMRALKTGDIYIEQ